MYSCIACLKEFVVHRFVFDNNRMLLNIYIVTVFIEILCYMKALFFCGDAAIEMYRH